MKRTTIYGILTVCVLALLASKLYSDTPAFPPAAPAGIFEKHINRMGSILWSADPPPVTAVREKSAAPVTFTLKQNYPNPFNPKKTITCTLNKAKQVTLEVFDLSGHKIRTLVSGVQASGGHQTQWDATNNEGLSVASRVYLYRLNTGDRAEIRKMMFVR